MLDASQISFPFVCCIRILLNATAREVAILLVWVACLSEIQHQMAQLLFRTTHRGSRPGRRDERAKESNAQIDERSETRAERTLIFTESGQLIRGQIEELTANTAGILHTMTSTGQRDEERCGTPTNTIHHRLTNIPRHRSSASRALSVELSAPSNHRFDRNVASGTAQLIRRQCRIGTTRSLVGTKSLFTELTRGKGETAVRAHERKGRSGRRRGRERRGERRGSSSGRGSRRREEWSNSVDRRSC